MIRRVITAHYDSRYDAARRIDIDGRDAIAAGSMHHGHPVPIHTFPAADGELRIRRKQFTKPGCQVRVALRLPVLHKCPVGRVALEPLPVGAGLLSRRKIKAQSIVESVARSREWRASEAQRILREPLPGRGKLTQNRVPVRRWKRLSVV